MKKTSEIELIIELSTKHNVCKSSNTITIISWLNTYIKIDGIKIEMDIKNLFHLMNKLDMFDYFKEKSLEEITKLQDYFINYKNSNGYEIKDVNHLYYKDLNISYNNNGNFIIVLADETGRTKLIDTWKDSLEELSKKYFENFED